MSSGHSQAKRLASFRTPLGDDFFVLTRFDGTEGLSELFEFQIEALSDANNADLSKILGEVCRVEYRLRGDRTRTFCGVLAEAQFLGPQGERWGYRFVLRPWLWLLSQRSDCRIFHDKTAPEIIKEIFKKEGKSNFDDRLTEQYQRMEYCVQYRETDLDFACRLMEQHGIYYYFKHSDNDHKLVLSDSKSSHDLERAPANASGTGDYPFLPRGRPDRRESDHLVEWQAERRLRTGRVELNDYDFKQSTADLRRSKEEGIAAARRYERYDYPGKYIDRKDGERFAEILVQAQQALDERRYADGEAPSLYPGALFTLSGHPVRSENAQHMVVRASHSFGQQAYRSEDDPLGSAEPYRGKYEFLKSERRFRALPVTPKPLVYGPQTARVVAKKRQQGEEIDVDEYGCIYVQFHWDRESETTSRRVRVAQVWSGKGWGGQVIPRIGQEVVVEFLEGDPDQPLIVGTVYNDKQKLPYDLPANKTQSGLKSNSTKGGNGYNEFKFEDKKGEEAVSLHAEKDLDAVIKHAETREIGEEFSPAKGAPARSTTVKNGDDVLKIDKGSLLVEATTSIVLKVGLSTITVEPDKVTIDSPQVTVKSVKTEVTSDMSVIVKGGIITLN